MSESLKPSWPQVIFLKGKATRRRNFRQIAEEKDAKTRKGIVAELLGNEKREIEEARAMRELRNRERKAVDDAVAKLPPEARCKIVRTNDGKIFLKRKDRGPQGKFLPNVKIEL